MAASHASPSSPPSASRGGSRVLAFLRSLSGRATVLGIHNDLKVGGPSHYSEKFRDLTGKAPGLWSCDFLFDGRREFRWEMIREAERQWRSGALVNLMWHAAPPTQSEPCAWEGGILSRLEDEEWASLVSEGGVLNTVWRERMDALLPYLEYLAQKGVEVLWRPLHEMNQEKFWWGGRPGPAGSALLYRLTHDYLTRVKGLRNLVWTWDIQDLRFDWGAYHPGEDVFDVLALDMYSMGFTRELYDTLLDLAGGKVIALGEVARLPEPEVLRRQSAYAFVMGWANLPFARNSREELRALADSPSILTLERMPGWGDLRNT
jgi:mannan endo-1,4-beta-mannosidase